MLQLNISDKPKCVTLKHDGYEVIKYIYTGVITVVGNTFFVDDNLVIKTSEIDEYFVNGIPTSQHIFIRKLQIDLENKRGS